MQMACAFLHRPNQLQTMVDHLVAYAKKWLIIIVAKSEVVHFNSYSFSVPVFNGGVLR